MLITAESTIMISLTNARKILGPNFSLDDAELSKLLIELVNIGQYAIDDHLNSSMAQEEEV
jgi:hypothetical protein